MDSATYLAHAPSAPIAPVYVLFGDEGFLRRQLLLALRKRVLESDEDTLGLTTYEGEHAGFAAVRDELSTLPFLCPRRLVVVRDADPFVTAHRAELERLLLAPPAAGVLVLDVKSWPSNTRLAKMVPADQTIECKAPATQRLPDWCMRWSLSRYLKEMDRDAAALLVELIGSEMGVLDQELAKLAIYAGSAPRIDRKSVDALIGRSRDENIWQIFDSISSNNRSNAMRILTRLLADGEEPLKILGAFSYQLRRVAQVNRLTQAGKPVAAAIEEAAVPPFGRRTCEQLLRHLGPSKLDRMFDWLLEVDQGIKGGSQLDPSLLLERLLVRLAMPA